MASMPGTAVIPEPHMLFQPGKRYYLTSSLYPVDGDMFFSQRSSH